MTVSSDVSAGRALSWLAIVWFVIILAAHVALLPLGRWQGDEYLQAALARDYGAGYLLGRLSGSSPRPASEAVLFVYYYLVSIMYRPLIRPFLVTHWVMIAASCFICMSRQPTIRLWRVMIGAAVLTMFLLGHDISELFFWPAAVAPYLTTLSAVSLCLFLTLDGRTHSRAGLIGFAFSLIVAAASSEAGAMFVGAYAMIRLVSTLRCPVNFRVLEIFCCSFPLLVAAVVLGVIGTSARIGGIEFSGVATATLHRSGASLLAALPQLGLEVVGLNATDMSLRAIIAGTTMKLLFFLGFRLSWPPDFAPRPHPREIIAFVAAILLGAVGMIAAANYQYGGVCCSRHDALRQCWYVLALAALAGLSATNRINLLPGWAGPVLLIGATILPFSSRTPRLMHDYRLFPAAVQARTETWRSGLGQQPGMVFYPPPEGQVIRGAALPDGYYRTIDGAPWWVVGLLELFHKQAVLIRAPK